MAFGLGSLFMVLLIIVYWDDIGGGFNLYPLQEHKHMSHGSASELQTTTGPSLTISSDSNHASSSSDLIASNKTLSLKVEEKHEEEEEEKEEADRGALEQRHEERTGNAVEENRRHETFVDEDQEVRKRRIADMCSGMDTMEFPGRTRAFEQIPNRELDHLIVDDTHQIIYCFVPKVRRFLHDSFWQTALAALRPSLHFIFFCLPELDLHAHTEMFTALMFCPFSFPPVAQVACTNWKRVMVVLSQSLISPSSGKPYSDPEAVPPELVHNSSLHLTFAKYCHSADTVAAPHTSQRQAHPSVRLLLFYVMELEGVQFSGSGETINDRRMSCITSSGIG